MSSKVTTRTGEVIARVSASAASGGAGGCEDDNNR